MDIRWKWIQIITYPRSETYSLIEVWLHNQESGLISAWWIFKTANRELILSWIHVRKHEFSKFEMGCQKKEKQHNSTSSGSRSCFHQRKTTYWRLAYLNLAFEFLFFMYLLFFILMFYLIQDEYSYLVALLNYY